VRCVPRSQNLTAESPNSIERIRAAFDDAKYWQARLAAFEDASPTLDSLATDAAGTTSVTMTMRFGGDQLPGPLQLLRLGSLQIVQRERWHALSDGTVRGEIAVDAPRTPITGDGSVTLSSFGSGTRLAGTARVEVSVPLIGGKIAGFVAGQLANGIVDIVHITDSWLAQNP
jgi:hypothetical protein